MVLKFIDDEIVVVFFLKFVWLFVWLNKKKISGIIYVKLFLWIFISLVVVFDRKL